jgi:hypothetical protein
MGQVKQRIENLHTERRFIKEKIGWTERHQPNNKVEIMSLKRSLRVIESEITVLQGCLSENPPIYVVTVEGLPQN